VSIAGLSILAATVGYLLGSLPTAYLLVKWKTNLDIRHAGSGNVGMLNSFLVTRSKFVGFAVLLFDIAKGCVAVWVGSIVCGPDFVYRAIAGCSAVLGHDFPIWLGGKGGRGLATAAGVMLLLGWAWIVVWIVVWAFGFLIWRNVNLANAFGSFVVLLGAGVILPDELMRMTTPENVPHAGYRVFAVALMGLVLLRLVKPLREFLKERNLNSSNP